MPDFLKAPFMNGPAVSPLDVLLRLITALVLGCAVALIYRQTRKHPQTPASFTATLVLLAVLIAMVTQVIGDNIARAFSLVGALSIVRFRTVVRDTEDTAYVIFAVVVGMAVGARNLWVAVIGLFVVALAAVVMLRRYNAWAAHHQAFVLSLRVAVGHDPDQLLDRCVGSALTSKELLSIETAKQGLALDVTYLTRLAGDQAPGEIIRNLNRVEGVQSASLQRRGPEDF